MRNTAFRVAMVLSLGAGLGVSFPAHGQPPSPASAVTAARAFVGDPLWGLGAGEPGELWSRLPDSQGAMASTTKTMAILVAVEAVAAGLVSLQDVVTFSANALNKNGPHGTFMSHAVMAGSATAPNGPALAVGDAFRLEDLLHAVMITSGGDVTVAVAEHVGMAAAPKDFETLIKALLDPLFYEKYFTGMMNARAQALGLTGTLFENPYGSDHDHLSDGSDNQAVDHRTTPRELARWMNEALKNPEFARIMGFRGVYSFASIAGDKTYTLGNWFPGDPGTQAWKPGSNVACGDCGVAQGRRIGREVVLGFTQAATSQSAAERTALFNFGFASIFWPQQQGLSGKWMGAADHDVACVTADVAASAAVTIPGQLRVGVWGLDVDTGAIAVPAGPLNPGLPPLPQPGFMDPIDPGDPPRLPPGFVNPQPPPFQPPLTATVPRTPPPRGSGNLAVDLPPVPPRVPPGYSGNEGPLVVQKARIASLGGGRLLVAAETTHGIQLSAWAITPAQTAFQTDVVTVSKGSDVAVAALSSLRGVVAYRTPDGKLAARTYQIDASGNLDPQPMGQYEGFTASSVALAVSRVFDGAAPVLGMARAVLVGQITGGGIVTSLAVNLITGQIAHEASATFTASAAPQVAAVSGLPDTVFAVASPSPGGNVRIAAWRVTASGQLLGQAAAPGADAAALASTDDWRLVGYREGGVAILRSPGASGAPSSLSAWSITAGANGLWTPRLVIEAPTGLPGSTAGACRVPGQQAEGDFVVGLRSASSAVRLGAVRSGRRP